MIINKRKQKGNVSFIINESPRKNKIFGLHNFNLSLHALLNVPQNTHINVLLEVVILVLLLLDITP